jgi:hypothetical protein
MIAATQVSQFMKQYRVAAFVGEVLLQAGGPQQYGPAQGPNDRGW